MTGFQVNSIIRAQKDWKFLPQNAAAAIIQIGNGQFLMQRRDDIPNIIFPNHLGLFGGVLEAGEDYSQALIRELAEEIGININPQRLQYHTRVTYDFNCVGKGIVDRVYYCLTLQKREPAQLVLGEGREMEILTATEIFNEPQVVPFDLWALWLHVNHDSLCVL